MSQNWNLRSTSEMEKNYKNFKREESLFPKSTAILWLCCRLDPGIGFGFVSWLESSTLDAGEILQDNRHLQQRFFMKFLPLGPEISWEQLTRIWCCWIRNQTLKIIPDLNSNANLKPQCKPNLELDPHIQPISGIYYLCLCSWIDVMTQI